MNLESGAMTTVSIYNYEAEYLEDLESLNKGRYDHACAAFYDRTILVLIVTGGYDGSNLLDTTEVMRMESGGRVWKTVSGKLPTVINGFSAKTIGNKVWVFG